MGSLLKKKILKFTNKNSNKDAKKMPKLIEKALNFTLFGWLFLLSLSRVKSTSDLDLKDRLVAINRVTKVTKGGRTFSFAAIVVVGNEDGVIGWGLGKASEVTTAIAKGTESAKKNLIRIPIHKGTIPHEQTAKFGGAEVIIKPATHGTGVKAGGAMRAVLESVGVTDVLAKSKGSSNPHNLVKATIAALNELRSPAMVAQNRNVSIEKVFKG